MALGAGRRRIARQLLTEAVLIALAGAAIGWVLADWGMHLTLSSIPEEFPFWMNFAPDAGVLLFTIGISVASGLLFGLAPLAQISHVQLNESLKEGGHAGIGSRGRARLRNGLVIAEIALALILLVGAGLMARSFVAMSRERTNLDPRGVLTGAVTLPVATYPDDAARLAFFDAVMPRIAALPGVTCASGTNVLPLGRSSWTRSLMIDGQEYEGDEDHPITSYGVIRPDYFRSLGIPMRSGRDFNASDVHRGASVAIVNESAAKAFWKDRDPIGMRLKFDADSAGWRTVVGVVADVRQHVGDTSRPEAQIFVPHTQDPHQTLILTVRADAPMGPLTAAVREILIARDPDLPFYEVRSMEEHLRIAVWDQQLFAVLMSVFAGLALLIAAVGIYGVMAYTVAQRTQEIGIRMALGAEQRKVLVMVVGQALKLAGTGVAIGLAGAFALTRLMEGLLFGVRPDDPPTFAVVTMLLALSAVIAAWIPARRAARVDPMVALRCE
jgi:predicted permease